MPFPPFFDAESAAIDIAPGPFLPALDPAIAVQLLEVAGGFVARVDIDGRFLAISGESATHFGYPHAYLAQVSLLDLALPAYVTVLQELLHAAVQRAEIQRLLVQFAHAAGHCLWLHLCAQSVSHTYPAQLMVVGQDVTPWVEAERSLRAASRLDPLTGIGNRLLMRGWINDAIAATAIGAPGFAVALFDVDDFKRINVALGRDAGDDVLRAVSERLQSALRRQDALARVDSDKFAMLLRAVVEPRQIDDIVDRIVSTLRYPFSVAGRQVHITTSVGTALYPAHGTDDNTLLQRVDLAMVRAKALGKNRRVIYSAEHDSAQTERFALELAMFEAFKAGEFALHYQPIVNPRTAEVRGAEALMRWTHLDRPVPPSDFIPVAEGNGLIHLLGSWAIRTACTQVVRWDDGGRPLTYITVNVSPVQLHHPAFPAVVFEALDESGLAPERLMLEITEGALMKQPEHAAGVLETLSRRGVRFAIDDFGTGYSNLAYLRAFPLHALKIDRSFIIDMAVSSQDRAIVAAVLSLAKALDLDVIAEGVETASQRDLLIERHCEYAQGWFYEKAMAPDAFEAAVVAGSLTLSSRAVLSAVRTSAAAPGH